MKRLVECQSDCAQDPECVAVEWGQISRPSPAGFHRSYPTCTFFEGTSIITHVLPTTDGAECFIKPKGASPCVTTKECTCCYLAGPGADFTSGPMPCEDLRYGDLRLMNLEGANLANVDLTCASFEGANLRGTIFRDSAGSHAVFTRANLENAVFERATLNHANFVRANLAGANFGHSQLENGAFNSSVVRGATFEHANLFQTSWSNATGVHNAAFFMAQNLGLELNWLIRRTFTPTATPTG